MDKWKVCDQTMNQSEKILEIKDLCVEFKTVEGTVKAINHLNYTLHKGEKLGIVGESGSGKSVSSLGIMQLIPNPPGEIVGGEILYKGQDLVKKSEKDMQKIRGNEISMIFQDSGAMMNPTRKVGDVFVEYLRTHEKISKKDAWAKGCGMLEKMNLPSPDNVMKSYPFQLSGGMRQRVGIAMGMSYQPKLLLADEPTSALDVTTQAQIVRQMMELRDDYGTSIIVVTHNLGIAAYMSDYIVVMKDGKMEDQGTREYILHETRNAYTRSLLGAVPSVGGERYV